MQFQLFREASFIFEKSRSEKMIILADKRLPKKSLARLQNYGEVLTVESSGITYPAISGHPDIFFCQAESELIVAPNLPQKIKTKIQHIHISFREGEKPVGSAYPQTATYNAVLTDKFLIHNTKFTDGAILQNATRLKKINVNQGYTRCNLLVLENDRFITSDKAIEKELKQKGLQVLFVNPKGILLPDFEHGFFGGCCGVSGNKIFIIGSLNQFPEGEKVRNFLEGYEIIELYDGPLFDGGGLFFV